MSVSESAAELLGDALVFEYLKSRGLARTAEVYALETRRKYAALADADELSAQLWVNFRQKLGINKFLRDEADSAAAAAKRASRGNSAAMPPPPLATSTLEFILKRTLHSLSKGGGGFDGEAAAEQDAVSVEDGAAAADGLAGADVEDGDARDDAEGGGGAGGRKAKKKKAKSRKYQPPPAERNPDVNHNLQYHALGKPVTRRPQLPLRGMGDGDEPLSLSRESWMPMELRLKMLKRDMELAKHKMKDVNDWEYRKQKQAPKTDAHTRRKTLQKLTQRSTLSRPMCALCEHDFPELPFGVTCVSVLLLCVCFRACVLGSSGWRVGLLWLCCSSHCNSLH